MPDHDSIIARLRAATEADVEAALAAMETSADLELVEATDLLAFFRSMFERLAPDPPGPP